MVIGIRALAAVFLATMSICAAMDSNLPKPDDKLFSSLDNSSTKSSISKETVNLLKQHFENKESSQEDDKIIFENGHLSQGTIITQLKKNPKRVEAILEPTPKNIALGKLLTANGATVYFLKNLHTKRVVGSDFSLTGSHNYSTIADKQIELMVLGKNDELVKAHRDDHHRIIEKLSLVAYTQGQTPTKEKPAVKFSPAYSPSKSPFKSPAKKTVINTVEQDFIKTLAQHIDNATDGGVIHLSTLTYKSQEFTDALVRASKRNIAIHLILDGSTFKVDDHYNQVKELADAGVDVTVWDPYREKKVGKMFEHLHHQKFFTRHDKNGYFALISTGNITEETNERLNHIEYHPGDQSMVESLIAIQKQVKSHKEAVPFADVDIQKIRDGNAERKKKANEKAQKKREEEKKSLGPKKTIKKKK